MEQAVKAWKPMGKFAAMMDEPPGAYQPAPQAATHDWGFGAKGAAKAWTPPATATVPTDWWKQDKTWVG